MLLEFSIPRKELRVDCIVLIRDVIVLLEAKTSLTAQQSKRQIEEYALLLHYFHKGCAGHRIVPVLVSPGLLSHVVEEANLAAMRQREFFPQLPTYWVSPVLHSSWQALTSMLIEIEKHASGHITPEAWDDSAYFPVPSILEAAMALRTGLSIREIAHSEASEHEIASVRETIQQYVNRARTQKHHAICFFNWGAWVREDTGRSKPCAFCRK